MPVMTSILALSRSRLHGPPIDGRLTPRPYMGAICERHDTEQGVDTAQPIELCGHLRSRIPSRSRTSYRSSSKQDVNGIPRLRIWGCRQCDLNLPLIHDDVEARIRGAKRRTAKRQGRLFIAVDDLDVRNASGSTQAGNHQGITTHHSGPWSRGPVH